ncbi:4'-phosphopantetheinyl transferase family protein [Bailinhaonella thermotolerans]|uniref:4'-phosphopantetheinyl transferase family protein n=1 Tax=Bailinhaonella thermotolerans TaxID=1070861 RepID=UPI00192A4500|nr:4'-phosphopantetheinyl transferase superfamily protein [Bailinhaonella thermotolerans]
MIERLLPPSAVAVEAYDDAADAPLYPEERAHVARAVEKRRREFATVRRCARDALAGLGVAPAPILPAERGAPAWPPGVVGSMTHCAGYRAAAVARAADLTAIGIDAEPHAPLPDGVLEAISRPDDRAGLAALPPGQVCWDRLLFCAKEAVYKAWFPLTRRPLGFEDASVDIDPAPEATASEAREGAFRARLHTEGPWRTLTGRWLATGALLITVITVER